MGITIHYKGRLDSPDLIDSFLEEVKDIANSMEWNFTSFSKQEKKESNLKGLFIYPHPNSEFLQFMIDEKGHFRNALLLENFNPNDNITYLNHIKTQFAPIELHIAIIKLFKYLKKRYVKNLEVWDEGDYWKTCDKKILQEKFDFLNNKMDEFSTHLKEIPFKEKETKDSIIKKIEDIFRKMTDNSKE